MLTATKQPNPASGGRRWRPLLAILLLALPASALAIAVDVGDGAGTIGDTIDVPVTVADLTGQNVTAYELRVTWSASRATLVDAPVAGTLTAPWGPVTFNTGPGWVEIVAAGALPLAGDGVLLNLQFLLGPSSGGTTLSLAEFLFNEGSPPAEPSNGYLTVSPLPSINISPDSGEIVVGGTLTFGVSGGTSPYTYGTTNPAVAIFANEVLHGVTPGTVRAWVEDATGVRDTTTGFIDVRAVSLDVGEVSTPPAQTVLLPVAISDPSAFHIWSAEFSLTFNQTYLSAVGVDLTGTVAGALGWTAEFNSTPGRVDVSLVGIVPLASPGTLIFVEMAAADVTFSTNQTVYITDGMCNEIYPPLHLNGMVQIVAPPSITVSPNTAELTVGETLQFEVTGSPTPPIAWSLTEPAVGSIWQDGLFTALAAGVTRVVALDDAGATDTSDDISVCDFYLLGPEDILTSLDPMLIPIEADRSLTGLGIQGFEITLTFNPNLLTATGASSVGAASAAWGQPVYNNLNPGEIIIVHAGPLALEGDLPIVYVEMQGDPDLMGTSTVVYVADHLFNEGAPCAFVVNGQVGVVTDVPDRATGAPRLGQNTPNPFNPETEIKYDLPRGGRAAIRIYDAEGRLLRTLCDRDHAAGLGYTVQWDGRDDRGRRLASGVYHYRLETPEAVESRKLVLVK